MSSIGCLIRNPLQALFYHFLGMWMERKAFPLGVFLPHFDLPILREKTAELPQLVSENLGSVTQAGGGLAIAGHVPEGRLGSVQRIGLC